MTLLKRPKIAVMITAMAAALGACVGIAGPAGAAQAPKTAVTTSNAATASSTRTITLHRIAAAGARAVPAAASISCTIVSSNLYIVSPDEPWGPYEPPFITSLGDFADVACTAPVQSIAVQAALAWDGDVAAEGPQVVSTESNASGFAYAIDVCSSGDWQTGGVAVVTPPAGYSPSTATLTTWSASYTIQPTDCN
jgi:hypothetical protein